MNINTCMQQLYEESITPRSSIFACLSNLKPSANDEQMFLRFISCAVFSGQENAMIITLQKARDIDRDKEKKIPNRLYSTAPMIVISREMIESQNITLS